MNAVAGADTSIAVDREEDSNSGQTLYDVGKHL